MMDVDGSAPSAGGRLLYTSEVFRREDDAAHRGPGEAAEPRLVAEPARDIPMHAECDVLVVGGGPAGIAAAVAAARLGARTLLLERYNHLGGLATGGLVIWIDRMTDWSGRMVIRGFAEEYLDRLPKGAVAGPPAADWGSRDAATAAWWAHRTAAFHGIVTWSPTCDPEAMKLVALQMVAEAGADILLHAWGAMPILREGPQGPCVGGAIFESKQGRRAVLSRVVVDATGDGDLFHRAGAPAIDDIVEQDIHHSTNTAWLFGGVDMPRWLAWRAADPEGFSAFMQRGRQAHGLFERPLVSWRDDVALFLGPRLAGFSALDVDDQTAVELRSRRAMAEHLAFYRAHAPGFAEAFIMLTAPQLGVRHTRRLVGVGAVTREGWDGRVQADEIGVSPPLSPKFGNVSVGYGALVPARLDGLLAPGRHLSCDATSHSFMREIPQCWLTGQAAGVAAALAVQAGVEPRAVDVRAVQRALLRQGAWLNETTALRAAA
jgi:hypothetical protein